MRILVVKMSSLGDIVQTWPALVWLKRRSDSVKVDWAVESEYASLVQAHPMIDQVFAVPFREWRRQGWIGGLLRGRIQEQWRSLTSQFCADHYDAVIDFQSLIKSALLCRVASGRSGRGHGWQASSCREPLAAAFYDSRHPGTHYLAQHAVLRYISLMAQVWQTLVPGSAGTGFHGSGVGLIDTGVPQLIEEADIDYGMQWQGLHTDMDHQAIVWLLHGSARTEKCWEESSWIAVGRRLSQFGYRCAVAWGTPEEQERARRMVSAIPNAWMPMERPTYATWMGLFSRSAMAIGVDSGLLYLAAAAQVPTLGLYLATSPEQAGVMGRAPHKNLARGVGVETVGDEALKLIRPGTVF